jgi:hypothetical protein
LDLIGFTDSDWAGDNTDCKSTSGYTLSLGFRAYLLVEQEAIVISLSSTEVEYRGVVNITIQALWLQNFLTELGISSTDRLSFGVTTRVLSSFAETQCSGSGKSISRSICTTSEI